MPERVKGIERLLRSLHDSVWYNNNDYTMHVDGEEVDREEFFGKYESAYDHLIRLMDWNRVLLEATGLHLTRQGINPKHKTAFEDYGDELCPDCVMQALLADSTFIDWKNKAKELEDMECLVDSPDGKVY